MIRCKVVASSVFADQSNVGQMDVTAVAEADGRKTVYRLTFDNPHVLLDAAEKMHLVGTAMLRFAPRPQPTK